jgi:hypothetical protein
MLGSGLRGACGQPDPAATTPCNPHLDDARLSLGEPAWEKARDEGAMLAFDAALQLAIDR